jgi:hypothetical protein
MLSRICKRSYHISGKLTNNEEITSFIIKSIENINYDSAKHTLKEYSTSLSRSNINAINTTLKNNQMSVLGKLYGYVIFGQGVCYCTSNYATFPIILGSFPYVMDCINHEKMERLVESIDFTKQTEENKKVEL